MARFIKNEQTANCIFNAFKFAQECIMDRSKGRKINISVEDVIKEIVYHLEQLGFKKIEAELEIINIISKMELYSLSNDRNICKKIFHGIHTFAMHKDKRYQKK